MNKSVAIFAWAYNERAIGEWVKYYLKVGVKHFFIYDDISREPIEKTLKDQNINDSYFTIIRFDKSHRDVKIDNNIKTLDIRNQRLEINTKIFNKVGNNIKKYDYLFYIDADEYLVLGKETLNTFIEKYKSYDSIHINWLNFGSNKICYLPFDTKEIIKHFKRSSATYHRLCKSITKICKIKEYPFNPHSIPINNEKNIIKLHLEGDKYKKGDIYIAHFGCQDLYTFAKRKFSQISYSRFLKKKMYNITSLIEFNHKIWTYNKFKFFLSRTNKKINKILNMYDKNEILNNDVVDFISK